MSANKCTSSAHLARLALPSKRYFIHTLDEGNESDLWQSLYKAGRDKEYTITRYGLNSIAEVAGWARPDVAPPRNGRTSKVLKALGYDVRIY